jgi:hypothetical protein
MFHSPPAAPSFRRAWAHRTPGSLYADGIVQAEEGMPWPQHRQGKSIIWFSRRRDEPDGKLTQTELSITRGRRFKSRTKATLESQPEENLREVIEELPHVHPRSIHAVGFHGQRSDQRLVGKPRQNGRRSLLVRGM